MLRKKTLDLSPRTRNLHGDTTIGGTSILTYSLPDTLDALACGSL